MLMKWQNTLKKNPYFKLVMIIAITFFLITLGINLHRYYSFYASYDQGIFNQVYWNSLHGRFFQSSLSSALSASVAHEHLPPEVYYHRLGQHFTPALLLWLPIYALFPSPVTLTVLQVTFVTAAGLVLYAIAREYLEPSLSGIITISFYCAIAVICPTIGNFHDISQIPLFVFTLLLAMEKRWWWLFWLMVPLILAVREDAGIILFGVGFYLIVSKRYPRQGLIICCLSFLYIIALTNLVMPRFSDDIAKRFMMERFGQYAEGEDATTVEILLGMLKNPLRFIGELFTPVGETIKYFLGQWLPLAFIPAIAPASWMIAGFPLLKLLSAKGDTVLSMTIRYAMTVVPGIFYGTIIWWANRDNFQRIIVQKLGINWQKWRKFWSICLILSLIFAFTANPNRALSFIIPDALQPLVYVTLPKQWSHIQQFQPLLKQIPADASVATTTYLIPHLSSRRAVFRFPIYQFKNDDRQVLLVDYILLDIWQLNQYQPAFKRDRERMQIMIPLISQLMANGEYGLIGFADGVVLLKRGVPSQPEVMNNWLAFAETLQPVLQKNN